MIRLVRARHGRRIAVRRPGGAGLRQGVREGKMRIVGRATVEAVPRLRDGASRHLEPGGVTDRRARPELGGRPQDHRFLQRLRRGGAGHPDLLGQSGAELQDRARPERDNAAGTRRATTRATWSGSSSATSARLGTYMRQILDQGATNIAGVHFGRDESRKAVRRGTHQGGRGCRSGKRKAWRRLPR